jgi:hypothetical protein
MRRVRFSDRRVFSRTKKDQDAMAHLRGGVRSFVVDVAI